jgi:mRNA interferase HigB
LKRGWQRPRFWFSKHMVIISYAPIREFMARTPDVGDALDEWYYKTKAASWKNLAELKTTFNSADYVGNERFVFNIRGNRYRLIAVVVFSIRTVYIKFIGTHRAYDAIDAATIELSSK